MTNCVICHKALCEFIYDRPTDFVCVCFDCIKKQNEKRRFKIFD